MTYVPATIDDLVIQFPEFIEIQPAVITRALAEAARQVDETWIEADYIPATIYLAAHFISSGISAADSMGGGGSIQAEQIGRIAVTYKQSAPSETELKSTPYGVRFSEMRRLNHPPMTIV